MLKISVMYPHEPGARFAHDYYRETHMPLVQKLLGAGCTYYTVDKGLTGGVPGSTPTYEGMCHIFSESIELFNAAMAVHGAEITADIPRFTDIQPVIQISEVVVGHPVRADH